MKWGYEHACSHHGPPGVCGPNTNDSVMNGEGGVCGVLDGEPNYDYFFGVGANKVGKIAKKESAYAKKFGTLPELHRGGPS